MIRRTEMRRRTEMETGPPLPLDPLDDGSTSSLACSSLAKILALGSASPSGSLLVLALLVLS